MAKIWQKDYDLDKLLEAFTVGQDYILDNDLAAADCVASLAHGIMLKEAGILPPEDLDAIKAGFDGILSRIERREFAVQVHEEDCHTAIENALIETCGEAGKKIHTGRSRNDQVITALRVYGRAGILAVLRAGEALTAALLDFAAEHSAVPMPGRTHMQTAMPSSVGLWAGAWAEDVLDNLELVHQAYSMLDQSSLGSAASYGVPLPLDRDRTARLLGFSRVQNNVLYVNNSRGKFEAIVLDALDMLVLGLSKMAQDLILFSLPEFGYFSLPAQLCSGSSIMPQKKNPDGLELMRAKSATMSAYAMQVKNIIRSLPSGYNRDFQETKEPFMRGLKLALQCVQVAELTVRNLQVHPEKLTASFTPDIFATDAAIELVAGGMSFRDAYRKVGLSLDQLSERDPAEALKTRTYQGTTGNLNLAAGTVKLDELVKRRKDAEAVVEGCVLDLTGRSVSLFT
ncbi:MAG: argininosuccinate lyase [Spirochaetales bacterium]|nr:argininosuccinate lyase [Spirochaetales bacterium]